MSNSEIDILLDEIVETYEQKSPEAVLTLHNDDYNTFVHVIACLVTYCDHDLIQAEQAAHIVHNNGKCNIKHGEYAYIFAIYKLLLAEGLTVTIDMKD
jgi:ATP-dependent Clp protease adaptor protein ClpS